MAQLFLKRATSSRPSGRWNDDDFDVLADGAVATQSQLYSAACLQTAVLTKIKGNKPLAAFALGVAISALASSSFAQGSKNSMSARRAVAIREMRGRHVLLRARARGSVPPSDVTIIFQDTILRRRRCDADIGD